MEPDPSLVQTVANFRAYVLYLAEKQAPLVSRSLEDYLRALWRLIQQHGQEYPVSPAFFATLLRGAFVVDPLPFDENWLEYVDPPYLDEEEEGNAFAVLEQMICYQIADLRRM